MFEDLDTLVRKNQPERWVYKHRRIVVPVYLMFLLYTAYRMMTSH